MLQQPDPDDYVVATGEMPLRPRIRRNRLRPRRPRLQQVRGRSTRRSTAPPKTILLQGDASKARRVLGWAPTVKFEDLVREMVDADCRPPGRLMSQ